MAAVAPHVSHADHSLSPPRITFPREYNAAVDLVERNLAGGRGEKIAFIDDAGSCSYATLAQRVHRCANAWRRSGLRIEDRAVLLLHDSVDFLTAFLGAIRAGIVPIPATRC
jgi:benzoate-CoA ligase